MRYINLCTVDDSFEAHFIKDDLAEHGIPCIVTNEYITSLIPHTNGMLGAGIQILVDREQLDTAREILNRRVNRPITHCPNCHSTNIKYGLGTKKRLKRIIAIAIALLIVSPFRHIKYTYYCNDCKYEF